MSHCKAKTRQGKPCRAVPQENGLCTFHDPARFEEMQEHRRRNARVLNDRISEARRQDPEAELGGLPEDIEGVARWLAWVAQKSATGALPHLRAREVTNALKTLLDAFDKGMQLERVKELQEQIAQLQRGGPLKAVR